MAAQVRVQSYLEKHKVSALFEELMAKIIHTLPDDPLIYLSAVIERKIERKRGSSAINRRSTGDIGGGERPSNVTWASVDGAIGKERGRYEKPWQSNSKRTPTKTKHSPELSKPPTSKTRPSWNTDNKVVSGDFDDIWNSRQSTEKPRQTRERSRSRERAMDDPNALTFQSSGYYGPVRSNRYDDDPLADELPTPAYKQHITDQKSHKIISNKFKGQKNQVNRHRSQLKDLIVKQSAGDSGIEEDSRPDFDVDNGLDVMESADDLRNEGVKNVKTTGVRLAKRPHQKSKIYDVEPEPLVRVSICSRCARVVTGSDPVTNNQTDNGGDTSRSAVRFTPTPVSDDEFESVSQVSGPRRPVWQGDTDAESQALSPRKGVPMFESSGVPHKGRPMYKQETPRDDSTEVSGIRLPTDSVAGTETLSARPPTGADTNRTDNTSSLPPTKPAWSRKDSIDFEDRNVDSPDILASKGRSWAIPDDSEVSDIDWEKDRAAKTKFKAHKSKKYTGGQY